MKRLYWVEAWYAPGELPVQVELSCTEEHAINFQKNIAQIQGYIYTDEHQASLDFQTVHWAELREVKGPQNGS